MNYDQLHPGTIACHACQFCCLDDCPPLTELTGKDKPQRMRNYSHIVTAAGEWLPLSKGQKRACWVALCQTPAPQVAVIATSGQKHLLFRAHPGWWQFEELPVRPAAGRTGLLMAAIQGLLQLGFSKAEIEHGHYRQDRLLAAGVPSRQHDAVLKPHRGSPYFALALYLAQTPEEEPEDGHDVVRAGEEPARTNLAWHSGELQEPVSAYDLAAVRGQSQKRGVHEQPEQDAQLALL